MFETAAIVEKKAEIATGKFPAATKSLAILDKFERQERFGGEREQRKVEVNRAVEGLHKVFREILEHTSGWDAYHSACRRMRNRRYCADDVRIFSTMLAKYEGEKGFAEKAGHFLSAMVNRGREGKYAIDIENLSVRVDNIGFENVKDIVVKGDVGDYLGAYMKRGSITVEGGAEMSAGNCMKGGRITVNGDVGGMTGNEMSGGEIVVNGDDTGLFTGNALHGGKLTINGGITHLAACFCDNMKGGDIYQFGMQLVKDGKWIDEPENK